LIPVIVDRIDLAVVGPVKLAFQLQVIGGIREDQIDGICRKSGHDLDAIATKNRV